MYVILYVIYFFMLKHENIEIATYIGTGTVL